jgi:ornithine cyclodeaminase/alanine dehydrogenase-like protein (mu-crystallin family)
VNPLYLTEEDVAATLTMTDAVGLVEAAALALAAGEAQNRPRQRAYTQKTVLQVLAAAWGDRLGHKTYVVAPKPRGPRFWHLLFAASGELLAMTEADTLGQIRTGAASGVATRYMARDDARTAAIIGTGWQARSQIEAVCAVRPIERVAAWGRTAEHLTTFCDEMTQRLGIPVEPARSPYEAVADADVVCTMTSATTPVLEGAWLQPGTHVNAAGSNRANAAEIDVETVRRSAVVAVEDIAQAKLEAGDLLPAAAETAFSWDTAVTLADIVAGKTPGRPNAEAITLFDSLGIGLWDLAAAGHVYEAALAQNRGTRLPIPS